MGKLSKCMNTVGWWGPEFYGQEEVQSYKSKKIHTEMNSRPPPYIYMCIS